MDSTLYFQSNEGYFWHWEEEGTVVAIPGSTTIAYKDFVVDVLQNLSGSGIPPFGSLLLAIAATNPQGDNAIADIHRIIDGNLRASNSTREPLNSATNFLKILASLPKKLKEGKYRLLLLQTLFANAHNQQSSSTSINLVDFLKQQQEESIVFSLGAVFPINKYNNDFKVISLLARAFPNKEAILQKFADLLDIIIPLEIETDQQAEEGKDFIDELVDNNKTFPVGSLVKRLWSGLNIPYHNYLPSHQPLGGVADLTTKGEFDRLLVSEFANEDILFLSRLANNEALYTHREVPPQDNDLERVMLIDVSIKNWGTPKIIAYAIALAIIRHPKTNIHCSVFAVGNTYVPLSFESIDDIIEGIQHLDASLHPAEGLHAFFTEYKSLKKAEVFFITSTDSLRHPSMHKVINDHYRFFSYWIHADVDGNIDLYKRQQNSKPHVQHFKLALDEAWRKEPKAKPDVSDLLSDDYPILFPITPNPKKLYVGPDKNVFVITAEKNLLENVDKENTTGKGWRLIMENLPFNTGELSAGITSDGTRLLLLFNLQDKRLHLYNLATGEEKQMVFDQWRSSVYKGFLFSDDRFYFGYLGYPSRHWTFAWDEELKMRSAENIPKEITDKLKEQETSQNAFQYGHLPKPSLLKNISHVFINEVGNLVLNIHELLLTHYGVIKLERVGFKNRIIEATMIDKTHFQFQDGSSITINRSGMAILKSSNADLEEIYLPLAVDASLGMGTRTNFAGNQYYFDSKNSGQTTLGAAEFWKRYLDPFIETIKSHGPSVKAIK